jgi:hypothetical protein
MGASLPHSGPCAHGLKPISESAGMPNVSRWGRWRARRPAGEPRSARCYEDLDALFGAAPNPATFGYYRPVKSYAKISQAPTNPKAAQPRARFDVADLYRGPLAEAPVAPGALPLDEKLRQAYFWIVNQAIISPFYDIAYDDGPSTTFHFGDSKRPLELPSARATRASCCSRCSPSPRAVAACSWAARAAARRPAPS